MWQDIILARLHASEQTCEQPLSQPCRKEDNVGGFGMGWRMFERDQAVRLVHHSRKRSCFLQQAQECRTRTHLLRARLIDVKLSLVNRHRSCVVDLCGPMRTRRLWLPSQGVASLGLSPGELLDTVGCAGQRCSFIQQDLQGASPQCCDPFGSPVANGCPLSFPPVLSSIPVSIRVSQPTMKFQLASLAALAFSLTADAAGVHRCVVYRGSMTVVCTGKDR